MSYENEREVYKALRTGQDKYAYFLLAAAGAAIGFALTQTQTATISWSKLPLGLGVLAWGMSFFCGCLHLNYVNAVLFANADLLKVEDGRHPLVGRHPQMMMAASEGIRSAIETNSNRGGAYARWQFRFLVMGAASYVGWHVLEMYLRSPL